MAINRQSVTGIICWGHTTGITLSSLQPALSYVSCGRCPDWPNMDPQIRHFPGHWNLLSIYGLLLSASFLTLFWLLLIWGILHFLPILCTRVSSCNHSWWFTFLFSAHHPLDTRPNSLYTWTHVVTKPENAFHIKGCMLFSFFCTLWIIYKVVIWPSGNVYTAYIGVKRSSNHPMDTCLDSPSFHPVFTCSIMWSLMRINLHILFSLSSRHLSSLSLFPCCGNSCGLTFSSYIV